MRIGSLFSGAGGLDMAVEAVFGGVVVWQSEVDKAASKVLAQQFPWTPNLGDITTIDWNKVQPVDVLCGGFPCQDVSAAGKRAGIKDGTRSGLWAIFAQAIGRLRPPIVIIENVRGLLSARAHRNVEPADGTVGDQSDGPVLRAAGAVLGDLADLGYDAQWATVAAGDVGAPHRRERVFIVAHSSDHQQGFPAGDVGHQRCEGEPQPLDAAGIGAGDRDCSGNFSSRVQLMGRGAGSQPTDDAVETLNDVVFKGEIGFLLPTCVTSDYKGAAPSRVSWENSTKSRGDGGASSLADVVTLFSTPQARDHKGRPGDNFNFANLCRDVALLCPTAQPGTSRGHDRINEPLLKRQAQEMQSSWGKYAPAIHRWEQLTRPAPPPTEPNKNGNPRLSAAFSEWLMGWPAGWVTDPDIGISRNDQLRIVGNGVVPQQAIAALTYLLKVAEVAA